MYLVGWLSFLILEKCTFVEDILYIQQCTPLWSPELYALVFPSMLASWVLLLLWAHSCGKSGMCGWPLVQVLFYVGVSGHWLVRPGHEVAGSVDLGFLGASAGPLVGGTSFWGRWLWDWGSQIYCWPSCEGGCILEQLTYRSNVSWRQCWPAGKQSQDPGDRVASAGSLVGGAMSWGL